MTTEKKRSITDIEWESRTLCSDESCIGIIGPDGRCKECGIAYDGEFKPVMAAEDVEADLETSADEFDDNAEDDSDENLQENGDTDWENRTLCVDESCIGVIGPDGRCKECGKTLEDEVT